jgi:hypothetical protein
VLVSAQCRNGSEFRTRKREADQKSPLRNVLEKCSSPGNRNFYSTTTHCSPSSVECQCDARRPKSKSRSWESLARRGKAQSDTSTVPCTQWRLEMRVRIARAPVLNWLMRSYRNLLQMTVDRRPDDSKEILTVPCDVRRGRLAVVHRTAACI